MRVTNLISNPSATFTLVGGAYTPVSTTGKKAGTKYVFCASVHVAGRTVQVGPAYQTISSDTRIVQHFTSTSTSPMSVWCKALSGSPTVTVSNLMLVEESQYQACKDLLDQIEWFDGDTMPLT